MENGDETFASPAAAAAAAEFEFDQALDTATATTNGGSPAAKPYDAAEIDALRDAKRDLEEKLAKVTHENEFLAKEARRLETLVAEAQGELAAADDAVDASKAKLIPLLEERTRLGNEKMFRRKAELCKMDVITAEMEAVLEEKVALNQVLVGLKASAASAAAAKKEETAASSTVVPNEAGVASHRLVAAAAAGAAATAAIAVVFLHLKR